MGDDAWSCSPRAAKRTCGPLRADNFAGPLGLCLWFYHQHSRASRLGSIASPVPGGCAREITIRGVVLGALITLVFTAANVPGAKGLI